MTRRKLNAAIDRYAVIREACVTATALPALAEDLFACDRLDTREYIVFIVMLMHVVFRIIVLLFCAEK